MDVDRNLPSKIKSWRNRGLHCISPQGKGTLKTVIDMTPKSQQRSGLGDPTKQTGKIGHRHIVHSTSQTVAAKSVELEMVAPMVLRKVVNMDPQIEHRSGRGGPTRQTARMVVGA